MKQTSRLIIIEVRLIADMRGVRATKTIFIANNEDSLIRVIVLAILSSINIAI